MTTPPTPLAVPPKLRRGHAPTSKEWLESGRSLVDLLCRVAGRKDLSNVDVLDVGCGTKLVKTLLDNSLPIGRYVGIDVSAEIIDWLRANVTDSRFEFHRLDAHNAMYNPDGTHLAEFELLPVGPRRFDLICLISVFTHLAPHDYVSMLRLLRRHAKPDTRLVFSLFLTDPELDAAYEGVIRERLASPDAEVRRRMEEDLARAIARRAERQRARFVDEIPGEPLKIARYDRDYALDLVNGTGWEVLGLHPPERFIQHYMICRPC